jgi:hypothetical protein
MRVCPMRKDDTNQTMRIVRGAAWRGAQPTRRRVRALHAVVKYAFKNMCEARTKTVLHQVRLVVAGVGQAPLLPS